LTSHITLKFGREIKIYIYIFANAHVRNIVYAFGKFIMYSFVITGMKTVKRGNRGRGEATL
jgi:hypothetical protein